MDTRVNGYMNYETWHAACHHSSTYDITKCWEERAEAILEATNGNHMEARYILAKELKQLTEEGNPLEIMKRHAEHFYMYQMYKDLLNAAIASVNWEEIADTFLER